MSSLEKPLLTDLFLFALNPQYAIVATNIAGETTAKFKLALLQTPPKFVRGLERAAEVDQGEKLELKALVEGSPNPVATWFKDGQEIEPSDR